ncbi:MAG TPA: energy transducer TonB [Vicinamibacteria bacterium]|jgi:protein TonB
MPSKLDCRSPFGALLDELRDEQVRVHAGSTVGGAPIERPGHLDPDLHIETGIVSAPSAPGHGGSRARWVASLAAHSIGLVAVVALPLLRPDDLPAPVAGARAFFVQPALAPPPPPPPPPPRAAAAPRPKAQAAAPRTQALIAPAHIPDQVKPEQVVEAAQAAGEAGGVEGGVPGGVVGGVIGGLPEAAPPPPPPSRVRAGIEVKEPTKIKNVDPVYPDLAVRANIQGVVILQLTIMPSGRVAEVRVLRSIALLDAAAIEAARHWVYTPTLLDGVPVSVDMTVTVRFNLREVRGKSV